MLEALLLVLVLGRSPAASCKELAHSDARNQGEHGRDLLAYQGMILKASEEGQCEGHYSKAWLDYDIIFRQAAVTKPEKWAQINGGIL